MNRIDRLTAILIHLQTKRVVKAQELADRFGISLRTVYRDVRALEEAGVPIGAEAGVGYFLEDYHLPPVMFTNAEASALMFGAKLVEKMADQSLRESFDSALFKIKAVLKRGEKDHLEDLAPTIDVVIPPRPLPFSDQLMNRIQAAIVQQQVLCIGYRASYATNTEREVEPIGLCYYGTGWHLIAYCRLRLAYRDFRLDRIQQLSETNKVFSRQSLLSLQDYLNKLRQMENLQEVVVWFEKEAARFAQQQKYTYGFVGEVEQGEKVQMRFLTQFVDGLGHWLMMYGSLVTVEEPVTLKHLMEQYALDIQQHYLTPQTLLT